MEAISKYNIMGNDYVRLDELNELIRDMKRKAREGKEPGYMCSVESERISASLALNHLEVVLNKESIHVKCLDKIMKTRHEREAKEQALKNAEDAIERTKAAIDKAEKLVKDIHKKEGRRLRSARYTVWKGAEDGETTENALCFVRWDDNRKVSQPMFSNRPCQAMWFTDKGMAKKTAEKLGDGWEVVDMWPVMTKEERLLWAIFNEDDDEDDDEVEAGE